MEIKRKTLTLLFVFAVISALLVSFELRPNFPDPDSFYHAKMALILRDHGFIKTFPWLKETIFNEHYVDHHFLYHVLLIPFVTFFDPMVGMKISATLFGLLAFWVIYKLLRALKAPFPEWLTLAAALSTNFIFRMALPRAPSLSLVFLLFGVWALLERKKWLVFFSAAAFVWLYNGWPLLLVVFGVILFGRTLGEFGFSEQTLIQSALRVVRQEVKIAGVLLAGLVWGLITHPYFPDNIIFSFLHILKIGFLNALGDIPVGREWYPASPSEIFQNNLPAVVAIVAGFFIVFLAYALRKNEENKKSFEQALIMITLAGAFIVMTLKSARYFEYSIPFIILAAGCLLRLGRPLLQDELKPMLKEKLSQPRLKIIATVILFVTIAGFAVGDYWNTRPANDYYQVKQYQGASDWIKNNTPANETVFHNIWDYSMILWYLDDSHYYLVGLDPMFMYDKNPERFRLWQKLSSGEDTAVAKITSDFGARVVIIDERDSGSENLMKNLRDSRLFTEVYYNQWLHVFASPELVL